MRKKEFFRLTPFKMQVLQSFPFIDADFDALTNYELLCKVVEYLNITVDNVNLLSDDFKTLYDYVHDYFDNLDVQEEINNKLDAMAESGQLTEIIAEYLTLAGVLAYNTVADMKSAENLVAGSIVKTLGYHNINDNGGSYYKIRNITNEDVVDEASIIAIGSGTLVAELILCSSITPEQFGCYGDGVHDDTTCFKKILNFSQYINVTSKNSKIYLISEKLYIQPRQELSLNGATLKCNNNELDYILRIDTSSYKNGVLKDITLDCNNICGGIYVTYGTVYNMTNIHIKNVKTVGIYVYQGNVNAINVNIENNICHDDSIGIYTQGTDSKFTNVIIKDMKTGIYNNAGINYYNMVHVWLSNNIDDSIGFYIHGSASLDNCYIDTYNIAIVNDNNQLAIYNNLRVFINSTIYNQIATKAPVFMNFTQASNNLTEYPAGASKTYLYSFNLIMDSSFTPAFSSCTYNDIMRYLPLKKISHNLSPFDLVDYYETELSSLSSDFNVATNSIRLYDNFVYINLVASLKNASGATQATPKQVGSFPNTVSGINDTFVKGYCGNNTGVDHGNINFRMVKTSNTNGLTITYVDAPNTYSTRLSIVLPLEK